MRSRVLEDLRRFNPHIVARDEWLQDQLGDFYQQIHTGLQTVEAGVREAEKVSDDYRPEVKARKQKEIVGKAVEKFEEIVEKALSRESTRVRNIQGEIERLTAPEEPKDRLEKLIIALERQELRQLIKEMPMKRRREFVTRAAEQGDFRPLEAVESFPFPLIPEPALRPAKGLRLKARAGKFLDQLEQVERIYETARSSASLARKVAERLAKPFLAPQNRQTNPERTSGMGITQKVDLIRKEGLEAFKGLIRPAS